MTKRIAHIDGLRASAALSVVLFHGAVHVAARPEPGSLIGTVLRAGAHGVDLFFVLSGFCLAYPYLERRHQTAELHFSVSQFAARRLVRILPPYYAAIALLFMLALSLIHAQVPFPQSMDAASIQPVEVVKQMVFSGHRFLASPFWTLAIEFRWYFLFPIVLWIWTRSRLLFALIGVLALITSGGRLHSYDLFFLPIFMLGIVAADLYVRDSIAARLAAPALPLLLAVSVASTIHDGWYFVDRGPLWGITMFCLVVAVGTSPAARSILSHTWMKILGAASYSIYLIHEPIIEISERGFRVLHNPVAEVTCGFCVAVFAGLVFSYVAERPFVEKPLKEFLVTRINRGLCRLTALAVRLPYVRPRVLKPRKMAHQPDSEAVA